MSMHLFERLFSPTAALLAIGLVLNASTAAPPAPSAPEPAFARISTSRVLRCGYVVYAPGLLRDPNSGALSGIVHDLVETAAARLDLKVEWTEETSWGHHLEGLTSGRYDMLCASSFALPSDAARTEAIGPLYFSTIGVWARPDDHRFDGNLAALNAPAVRISAIDGTIPDVIAREQFPRAKIVAHPQLTDYSFNMSDVADGKADVTFVENYQGLAYLAQNPGKLVNIAAPQPLRVYHNMILVDKGEFRLRTMFQTVIDQMIDNGEVDALLARYQGSPGALLRIAPRYQRP